MSFRKRLILILLVIAGLLLMAYSFFESRWVKITEIAIKSVEIPDSFNGSKVLFLTDIHFGAYLTSGRLSRIVKQVNALHPDLILLGGDYVNRTSRHIEPVFRELGQLQSVFGTYGALGNHDHWADAALTRKMMLQYGIQSVDNQSVWIRKGNDSIKIGGVGDWWEDVQQPENTLKDLKPSDFAILLSHNPDYLDNFQSDRIDLTLSGHTHGGQITFFGWWAPILRSDFGQKYRYGIIHSGKMVSYISSGIGAVLVPFRFFCRPEIVVIQLEKIKTR